MKQVFIDCTSIILSDLHTGIQRVERNLIFESISIAKNRGISLQPVCFFNNEDFLKVDLGFWNAKLESYLFKIRLCLNEYWRIRRLIKAVFPNKKFIRWIDNNWIGWKKWFLLIPCTLLSLPAVAVSSIYSLILWNNRKWQPCPNTLFIIPGSLWWDNEKFLRYLEKVKDSGCSIATIIYDIIPITHPEYCDIHLPAAFNSRFPLILHSSDLLIAISNSIKCTLEEFSQTNNKFSKIPKIEYFRLGCELDLVKKNSIIRKVVEDIFSIEINKPYLCVGTLEPRKNHKFLLDAFDKLWDSGHNIKLCIIGRHGWLVDDLIERILNHNQYGKLLFWFKDLTDNELIFCYKRARCLIFPSFVEGFGLPLVEALNYQCPVMASDIPVFHEIGGDFCYFFSLEDNNQFVELIKEYEMTGKLLGVKKEIKNFHWPNWKESTEEFWAVLDKYIA